jgi:hypothetical protein
MDIFHGRNAFPLLDTQRSRPASRDFSIFLNNRFFLMRFVPGYSCMQGICLFSQFGPQLEPLSDLNF